MNSDPQQSDDEYSVIEELSAYLDGELDQAQIQRVETRLGEDTEYLAEMQALQKTWDLLDVLPTTEPGTSFTKTTMELVVGEALQTEKKRRNRLWVWPGRVALMVGLPLLLFATAFGIIRKMQTDPDRMLIDNLSVIEYHTRYDSIDCDFDFLTKLDANALFSNSSFLVDDGGKFNIYDEDEVQIPTDDSDRREYVDGLDVQKKLKLKRQLEDFLKKAGDQQSQLKSFDQVLSQSEDQVQLRSTLNGYYDWLMQLESGERAELRDLPPQKRLEAIVKIRNKQVLQEFTLAKLPSKEDAELILGWCESVFRLNERKLRSRFPDALVEYASVQQMNAPPVEFLRRKARHTSLPSIVDVLMSIDRQFIEDLILDDRQMFMLYDMLSTKARSLLSERTPIQRRELVLNWVESANQSQCEISMQAIKQFERRLSVKERYRLEKMSTEDYVENLKRMYIQQRKSRTSSQGWWEKELDSILESTND